MEVAVTPQIIGAFEPFEQSLSFKVPENPVKYRNLAILAIILLGVGFGSGWILGRDQTIDEGEIAPQPVRMLLSGMTIVAIAVLYHVRLNTYTLEEVRQKAEGRRQKERKGNYGNSDKKTFSSL